MPWQVHLSSNHQKNWNLKKKEEEEEIKSNTRATLQTLQALVTMAHVKVHENIIRNRMKK